MAHEDWNNETKVAMATWHLLRVAAGEALPRHGPAHYNLTETKWNKVKTDVDNQVRKAASRMLLAA